MRLLDVRDFSLVQCFEPNIPPYAILSHRWEEEEVLFADIGTEHYQTKIGFRKVHLACEQAAKDGFAFIWIDSCCIDKSSSAELSEAINAMFRWYHEASVCYAFLSDVLLKQRRHETAQGWFSRSSAWFTRGWTLQELIAPTRLVLFDADWTEIGTRNSFAESISNACGVHRSLLVDRRGPIDAVLRSFTAAQKMSWAAKRMTTRTEDRAYSLLGLFGINMPLLYGEGNRAFIRLQEEILKSGSDLSILAWRHRGPGREYRAELLANSPSDFAECGGIVHAASLEDSSPDGPTYNMTNAGLRIERPFLIHLYGRGAHNSLALSLDCREEHSITKTICLKLSPRSTNLSLQTEKGQAPVSQNSVCDAGWEFDGTIGGNRLTITDVLEPKRMSQWQTLTVAREYISVHSNAIDTVHWTTHFWIKLPKDEANIPWKVLELDPRECWDGQNLTFDLRNHVGSGAIALSNKLGGQVTVHFAQVFDDADGFRAAERILFRASTYDTETFPQARPRLNHKDNIVESTLLVMGRMLTVRLRMIRRPYVSIALLEMEIEAPIPYDSTGPFELEA